MKHLFTVVLVLICLFCCDTAPAQLAVTQGVALGMTPLQLVQAKLVGQGITISNVTFNGSSSSITSNQIGSFNATNGALTQLGLSGGIIMSSGTAAGAVGPNNATGFTGSIPGGPGDPDLTIISNIATWDAAVLEFDFVPISDTLKFRYVFGSEEFMEFCNSINDAFGFFLSGPGITGTFSNNSIDLAIMPGTINSYVTINNLCNGLGVLWQNPSGGLYYQYDAFSYIFTAWHIVQPCQPYHIKLAVADASDHILDSGVFLEENSFSSTGFTVTNNFSHPGLGSFCIEGCSDATITFKLQTPAVQNDTIRYTIGGTATNGIDYTHIPDSVIIPAGQDSTFILISPYMDGVTEGTESVVLSIPMITCSGGTTYYDTVLILDNQPFASQACNDTLICQGQSITLHCSHTGGQPPFTYLWNTAATTSQITVTPPSGQNLYYIDITEGCGVVSRDTVIVNVSSYPVITDTNLISTVCNGGITNIPLLSTVPGATYTWTATCADPLISGYSSGGGTVIAQTLQNSGNTIDSVTYQVTAHVAGCSASLPKNFIVAVIPSVSATFNPNGQSVCSGNSAPISIVAGVPGTTFSWTFTIGSANISGATNGTGNIINNTLTNSGFNIDTVTYHVLSSNSGCPGAVSNVKAAVKPIPDLWSTPSSQSVCSGSQTSLALSSHVNGSIFSWTAVCPSPDVSGYSAGIGSIIIQTLTNNGIPSQVVTYNVSVTANSCSGLNTISIPVNLGPKPVLANQTAYSLCSPGATNIVLTTIPAGANCTWTASGSSNVTGYSAGSGSAIAQLLTNTGYSVEKVVYTITPAAGGCTGTASRDTVTINPSPAVNFASAIDVITTSNAAPIMLKGGIPSGGTYSGSGVSSGFFSPAIAGTGNHILSYTYTNFFGCQNNATLSIQVLDPAPFVCGNPMTDVRDNQQYKTIKLGTRCWMAEDLNYGVEIPFNQDQRDNFINEYYLNPSVASHHAFYQWDEVMKYRAAEGTQGLCPPAWHVPAENDWSGLFALFNGNGLAAIVLKSSGFSGFNALLSGFRLSNSDWEFGNFATIFWSSTPIGSSKSWAHGMNYYDPSVSSYPAIRNNAFSVRCVKDQ